MDYYDEFGHYNSCFGQNGPNWDNSYTYGFNNKCAYSDSSYSYDYQPECVQSESKPYWQLAIERLVNAPLPLELESEPFDKWLIYAIFEWYLCYF